MHHAYISVISKKIAVDAQYLTTFKKLFKNASSCSNKIIY